MIRTGLVGRSIMASKSPWLHEQEGAAQGLDLTYDLIDFTQRGLADDDLGATIRALPAQGYAGVNVTFPFKQAVIPLLDGLAESAERVGAVNTIAIRDGKLIGHNTDMAGFAQNLASGLPDVAVGHVLQLGAGGAGAAVAIALLNSGVANLALADIDPTRASALCDRLAAVFGDRRASPYSMLDLPITKADGIVNATPLGMAAHPGAPIDTALLDARQWVADIVYFPLETELLRQARARGCRVLDGSGMVIAQAAIAFEIMTGHPAKLERMRASFLSGLA
ncbi:shikimate dehydrogenase [Sphingomonas populi]|uniref:Shikimate dehydrogenase (NADP(+)) n=1 Tax=Sphingomonas populi TaxID=2484750 RepID=A0A4Q6Y1D6_9SPHN|nr:shikimate dehydrogenase [Sphingomonas populi]RZF63069.1 shikimate dehydrogenase [Sphingomonas populi]